PAPDTAPAMPKLIATKNPPGAWWVFYCRVAGKLVAQPVSSAFLMARCRFRHACAIYSDA
ncbi:hypothetical protein LQD23_06385, partial [Chromobacterium violaceum]|uniref:hypothetical protein n=1 Tax=Chromobacterium violaceum TaxID=536 RepID=UPI001E5CACF7